ncbi:MAG: hypothetical protein K0R66_1367 [Gammaproteobacteria bacterium]|nr:hypothetical protein [Gammaproteobacteria bacterium]
MAKDRNDSYVSQRNLMFSLSQDGKSAGGSHNVAFYFEDSALCKLTELVKYGDLTISKATDGFLIKIGDFPPISIVIEFQKTMVTMGNISTMKPGAAALLAKIAEAFLDMDMRDRRFKIQAYDRASEKEMWKAAAEQKLKIEAENNEQRQLFAEWAKEYGQQQMHKSKALFQSNAKTQPDNDISPDKKT